MKYPPFYKKAFWNAYSLKFVPNGPMDNNPSLFEVMAWHQTGKMPSSGPMMVKFTETHIILYHDLK